jgi:hypothetical protein
MIVGARRGQNNFRTHQRQMVSENLERVGIALSQVKKGMRFDDYNAFRRHIAALACLDPTTLGRNREYRKAIVDYLVEHPRILLKPSREIPSGAKSRAEDLAATIELANLKRDNQRLRHFIENRLGHSFSDTDEVPLLPTRPPDSGDQRAFEDTANVLARLLEHLGENELGIILDASNKQIRNLAEVGDQSIVAAPPQTKAFFEWMQRHNGRIAKG